MMHIDRRWPLERVLFALAGTVRFSRRRWPSAIYDNGTRSRVDVKAVRI